MISIENKDIALFDFCGTIVDFQTADEYVNFTRRKYQKRRMILLEKIHSVLINRGIISRLTQLFPKASLNKRIILLQLFGLSRHQLEESAKDYYDQIIKPHFIAPIINELKKLKSEGYIVIIVSGGYDIYLQYFASEFEVDYVLSTKLGFCGTRCTGAFDGPDCLWEEKLHQLGTVISKKGQGRSVAFSDSESDIPMLLWADEAYVVIRRNNSNKWSDKYCFKTIEWD